MVAARAGCPLVIGLGAGEFFIASDLPPILGYTKEIIFLDDYEMAVLCRDGVKVTDLGRRRQKKRYKPGEVEPRDGGKRRLQALHA